MNLEHLRERTRPQHNATESQMPITADGLTLAEYTGYLRGLYAALAPWESFALTHHPAALETLVASRRRAFLLEKDLSAFGIAVPAVGAFHSAAIPGLDELDGATFAASFLGAMYVVEGSSLGGQYIAKHLETTLGLTPEHGAAYFRGYGDRTGSLWQQFKLVLAALPDSEEDQVVAAAQGMFALFGEALTSASTQPPHPEMASLQ
ncbi:Heme oxygenase [Bryocella elongata]|uniref:Heme oxygenase n=1 Tax=Bryocella elongata TaxID=863522 RepID=A0A1H5Y8B7_9BACT|nr:biliverdin-producing heme oxygenase [Bryocella elongata]SEG20253.1 Heme oxygenase [Bryocella elongata]